MILNTVSYQQQAIVGATGIELVVALYDAALRNLHSARQFTLDGDVAGRRGAVKKAVDIVMYLQARLRPDVGGDAAASLSDFYAAMFTMALEASYAESVIGFDEVILCVRNVRDAWMVVARDPTAGRVLPRELRTREEKFTPRNETAVETAKTSRWSA